MTKDKSVKELPFFLNETVTLYAPMKTVKGVYHAPGEETKVHPHQEAKFLKAGYTKTAPAAPVEKEA